MNIARLLLLMIGGLLTSFSWAASADPYSLEAGMVHLRKGGQPEWSSFPKQADAAALVRTFDAKSNEASWTLSLRQQDVKQAWDVRLNDRRLGRLVRDENDLQTDFEVPAETLVDGVNRLEILQASESDVDDIRVGHVFLHRFPPDRLRNQATIQVELTDRQDVAIAGRITVLDSNGSLVPIGAKSNETMAVREGVVYTSSGSVSFGVAPGVYRLVAGRGFEYSLESTRVRIAGGERAKRTMKLRRVVDTGGWIACDTHVHTVTHSGHGDCTIEERMATLAGEGVELPIATDHNKHIDYRPTSLECGVDSRFTPVIGNEVTTKQGHYNIFPVRSGADVPDWQQEGWQDLFEDIYSTPDVSIAILNHGRDVHSSFRPFSPRHHLSLTGENLDGRRYRFNAMELINSGAVQTDPMQLFGDWCGLINRGLQITPVGSSDSHDVSRYIVGQGRTYIQFDDSSVGEIDVNQAVQSFLQGRVIVSYGLLVKLTVDQNHGPGDLFEIAGAEEPLNLTAEVHGPVWTRAESIELYVNGKQRFVESIDRSAESLDSSPKAVVRWQIPADELAHDLWLAAVATGPGVSGNHWKSAKPYQPDSPVFDSYVFSSTGMIRIDADGDGRYCSPNEYAANLIDQCGADIGRLTERLGQFHPSVTHQAMSILRSQGEVNLAEIQQAATGEVRREIAEYRRQWQQCQRARVEQQE